MYIDNYFREQGGVGGLCFYDIFTEIMIFNEVCPLWKTNVAHVFQDDNHNLNLHNLARAYIKMHLSITVMNVLNV